MRLQLSMAVCFAKAWQARLLQAQSLDTASKLAGHKCKIKEALQ